MATSLSRVIRNLKKLPGIGSRSAERIAFHLLEAKKEDVLDFLDSINQLVTRTIYCDNCGLISEQTPCRICSSPTRDHSIICLVKNNQDAIQIERSKSYFGDYHILGGLLSPLNHVYEEDLNITQLLKRIEKQATKAQPVKELIFALEQSTEAEITIQLVEEKILAWERDATAAKPRSGKNLSFTFSRMAVGIPMGMGLQNIDENTLKQSLKRRYPINRSP